MPTITLKQEVGDHLFRVIRDGEVIDHCDVLAAEEIAVGLEEQRYDVRWVYPEDYKAEGKKRA